MVRPAGFASVAAVSVALLGLSSLPPDRPRPVPEPPSARPSIERTTELTTEPTTAALPPVGVARTHSAAKPAPRIHQAAKPAPRPETAAKPAPRTHQAAKPTPRPETAAKPAPRTHQAAKPTPRPAPSPTPSPRCTRSAIQVPTCGLLWGIYSSPSAAADWIHGVTDIEDRTGESYDLVKRYHDWSNAGSNGVFPDPADHQLGAAGRRLLFIAWTSNIFGTGTAATWRDIAAGAYDESVVIPAADRLRRWAHPVFLDFDHEMDGTARYGNGTEAQYVAAYQHIHDVFAARGARNVIWVWTPTGYLGNADRIAAMYPGDGYVDWVGFDPYNFSGCRGGPWKDPAATIGGFYRWLLDAGFADKPFMLAEFGSAARPGDPAAKGHWYAALGDALASRPNIKAVVAFNSYKVCDFRVSADSASAAGYADLARHPHIR